MLFDKPSQLEYQSVSVTPGLLPYLSYATRYDIGDRFYVWALMVIAIMTISFGVLFHTFYCNLSRAEKYCSLCRSTEDFVIYFRGSLNRGSTKRQEGGSLTKIKFQIKRCDCGGRVSYNGKQTISFGWYVEQAN